MGKKKFIDKKKSAKLLLFARDSSDPSYDDSPRNGRVFVRVDNNSYSIDSFFAAGDNADTDDPNLIFADALEDCDIDEDNSRVYASLSSVSHHPLPEHVRKKILELGFPDDGYNYLLHLREIKNIGGGSAFYSNPKTRLDQLPSDVKAYDASRLRISEVSDECNEQYMYNVASETVSVSVKRAVDPEVATLLNDSNLSQFGSDVEDLEEDFVIRANFSKDNEGVSNDKGLSLLEQSEFKDLIAEENYGFGQPQFVDLSSQGGDGNHVMEVKNEFEKPRFCRPLDEQFDLLESREYASDDGNKDDDYGYIAEEDESLAEKLKHALNDNGIDDFDLDGKYKSPADLLHGNDKTKSTELLESARDVFRRCVEYAEKYENDDQQEEVVIFEDSTDESEVWNCESINSTYSNLDNHPGEIQAPEVIRKKKLAEAVFGALNSTSQKISLKGRDEKPVDFLPHGRKPTTEKVKGGDILKPEQQKRKQYGQESEEKKERKAAVKEERRKARRAKKEMKGLYNGEAQRAQRVAAMPGPPFSILSGKKSASL